jgi:hypothetical protein
VTQTEAVVPGVIELLDTYGDQLRWIHIGDSRIVSGTNGFPDFVILGPRGMLYRECKPHVRSPLSPHQTGWRYGLIAAGANYAVWTQEDLDNGTAERELEALL